MDMVLITMISSETHMKENSYWFDCGSQVQLSVNRFSARLEKTTKVCSLRGDKTQKIIEDYVFSIHYHPPQPETSFTLNGFSHSSPESNFHYMLSRT